MKKYAFLLLMIIITFSVSQSFGIGVYAFPVDSLKDQIIDNKIIQYNVILLDIRTAFDVDEGIIASKNCRPYHISYDLDDWEGRYSDLPKNVPIITYCNESSKALQAAQFLLNKGYERVAVLDGGTQDYKGILVDSTNFRPWSDLPQPSYEFSLNIIRKRSQKPYYTMIPNTRKQQFNLVGQRITPFLIDPDAFVFIIERQGYTGRKKIIGFSF
jgi:rhodanese-related sulfurtransferase